MIADGLLLKRAHQISAFLARHNSQSICIPSTWPFPTWDNWFDSLRCWQTPRQSLHGLIPQDVQQFLQLVWFLKMLTNLSTIFTWFDSWICWQTSRQFSQLVWFLNMLTNLSTIFTVAVVAAITTIPWQCSSLRESYGACFEVLTSWHWSKGTVHWFSLTPLTFVRNVYFNAQMLKHLGQSKWVIAN